MREEWRQKCVNTCNIYKNIKVKRKNDNLAWALKPKCNQGILDVKI